MPARQLGGTASHPPAMPDLSVMCLTLHLYLPPHLPPLPTPAYPPVTSALSPPHPQTLAPSPFTFNSNPLLLAVRWPWRARMCGVRGRKAYASDSRATQCRGFWLRCCKKLNFWSLSLSLSWRVKRYKPTATSRVRLVGIGAASGVWLVVLKEEGF